MPIVGIIADPGLEGVLSRHYATFACFVSETIRKEFQLRWSNVVLMSFSLESFGRKLMRSSQHCQPENRPRWWLKGESNKITDMILCDYLIYLTMGHGDDGCSMIFLQFDRRKKRIQWCPKDLKTFF